MADSLLRRIRDTLQLPSSRKAFLKSVDGNADALSEIQMILESSDDQELSQFWANATDGATSDDDVVESLANAIYPSGGGVRGKNPNAASEPPATNVTSETVASDSGKVGKTPYESLTAAQRTKLEKAGFPAEDTKAWTTEQLAATLADADKQPTKPAAGKKAAKKAVAKTAGETATNPQASAQAAAPGAKPAPSSVDTLLAGDDVPLPGGLGTTQSDLDAANEPIPGAMGLGRGDVQNYVIDGALGDAVDMADLPQAPPPAMDMSRLNAAGFPPPSPIPPSAMDMSRLGAAATPPPQAAPPPSMFQQIDWSQFQQPGFSTADPASKAFLSDLMDGLTSGGGAPWADPPPAPGGPKPGAFPASLPPELPGAELAPDMGDLQAMDGMAPGGGTPPDPTKPPADRSWAEWAMGMPLTSRTNEFLEARGLGKNFMGANLVTVPMDLINKGAAPYAAYRVLQDTMGNSGEPTQEEMDMLEARAAESRQRAEAAFGRFSPPAADAPMPQQPKPAAPKPQGRIL